MALKLPYTFSQDIKRRKVDIHGGIAKFIMEPVKHMCVLCRCQKENMNQVILRLDTTRDKKGEVAKFNATKATFERYMKILEDKKYKVDDKDLKTMSVYMHKHDVRNFECFPTNKGKRGFLKRKLASLESQIRYASYCDLKYKVYVCSEECFNLLVLGVS